jgi:hypothetical protein
MTRFVSVGCGVLMGGAALLAPARLHAQQKAPPPKRGQAIEIRGQVPTPQVVTVRPREVPAYDRQILSPAFYNGTGATASAGGVQLVPESQVRGTTALDTLPAGIAREGGAPAATGLAPLQVKADSARNAQAAAIARAGASAAEIEAMRRELAIRRARLDSLRRALNESMQTPVPVGKSPAPAPRRMSAADSAARAQEIESIRRELEYRRQRLDSLQREVRAMGRGRRSAPPKRTTPDSTAAPPATPR